MKIKPSVKPICPKCKIVRRKGKERKLVVYPAMWKEPQQEDTVYVSNAYIKYAKPYAVQKILNS